jgi:4-amino-4-deoxy-L-arabinose transferase-like glycosyltransferase
MDMPEQETAAPTEGRDWRLLGLLILLVLPLRCWLLYNTEVTARDGIGYIRYALSFEHNDFAKVLREQDQHPGYPLAIWAASIPVRAWSGRTDAEVMQFSAQLASALASLLLLYPMYQLGRLLLGRSVGFWGSLLFQYWPGSGQHLSDAISETIFLLLLVSAMLQAVRAVQGWHPGRFALCGLFCGLAYLTRPEGALLLPAVAMVLVAAQWRPAWRCSRGRWLACSTSLVLAACAIGSIYVVSTGHLTNKPSPNKLNPFAERSGAVSPQLAAVGHAPLAGLLFASSIQPTNNPALLLARSLHALFDELNHGFHYVGSLFVLFGLWWSFDTLRRRSGFWVLLLYSLIQVFILLCLGMSVLYLSERHTLILVLLGSYLVAVGLLDFPRRILAKQRPVWSLTLLLGIIVFCLPKTTERLHAKRVGNHAAGLWLAEQVREGDVILDDHYWSHFYSGLFFKEGQERPLPEGLQPWCYEVQTRTKGQELDKEGTICYCWPDQQNTATARVVVYRRPRDRATQPWDVMPAAARRTIQAQK